MSEPLAERIPSHGPIILQDLLVTGTTIGRARIGWRAALAHTPPHKPRIAHPPKAAPPPLAGTWGAGWRTKKAPILLSYEEGGAADAALPTPAPIAPGPADRGAAGKRLRNQEGARLVTRPPAATPPPFAARAGGASGAGGVVAAVAPPPLAPSPPPSAPGRVRVPPELVSVPPPPPGQRRHPLPPCPPLGTLGRGSWPSRPLPPPPTTSESWAGGGGW